MRPIVVNQQYEVPTDAIKPLGQNFTINQDNHIGTHYSYGRVLEQALTTKDDKAVQEILAYQEAEVVNSTLQQLPPALVEPLLSHIYRGLLKGNDEGALQWLRTLLRIHLPQIVNNTSNHAHICRIKNILKKRTCQRDRLIKLQQSIPQPQTPTEKKVHTPLFHYIEEEQKEEAMEEEDRN
jgi:hypothetical protein